MSVKRISVGQPWDECFGGGIVSTSSILFGSSPGGGKTVSLLQLSSEIAKATGRWAHYITAEQSPTNITLVAERLNISNLDRFKVNGSEFATLGEEAAVRAFENFPPAVFVFDTLSAVCEDDTHGLLNTVKRYKRYSMAYAAPSFFGCHMTKEHDYAGPLALQHEVDTLITVFIQCDDGLRELRVWKNRFGPTHKTYEMLMTEQGLVGIPEKKMKKGGQKHGIE